MYTKHQPGNHFDMISYLAELTGQNKYSITEYHNVTIKDFPEHLREVTGAYYKGRYISSLNTTVRKGAISVLIQGGIRPIKDYTPLTEDLPIDTLFDKIEIKRLKSSKDFDYPIQDAGTFKYCEGGGWYSTVLLMRVKDKYFTST